MARIFSASAEENSLFTVWDGYSSADTTPNNILYKVNDDSGINNNIWASAKPRTGNGAYRLSTLAQGLYKALPATSTLYLGLAFNTRVLPANNNRAIVTLSGNPASYSDVANISVWLQNGTCSVVRNNSTIITSGASVWAVNTWHYFELYVNCAQSGTVTLKLDGATIGTYNGDTRPSASSTYTDVRWIFIQGTISGDNTLFDDIALNNTSGTTNNSWTGQVRMLPIPLKGDGSHTGLTRVGFDTGANFNNAQSRGGGDFSAVQGTAADQYDLYSLNTPVLPVNAVINNVILQCQGRVYNGAGSACLTSKQGATTSDGTTTALSAAFKSVAPLVLPTQLDGSAWSAAALASFEVGIKAK